MSKSTSILRALIAASAVSALAIAGVAPAAAASSTTVSTSAGLKTALASARAGDTIVLADGTYTGSFVAASSGTSSARITLTGSSRVVLTTGSTSTGYGLRVTGDYWTVSGISISRASKGVVLDDADYTILERLDVGSTGQEAIHVRKSSTGVIIRNSVIHNTGLVDAEFGEGIYVGSANSNWSTIMGSSTTPDRSDNVRIESNTIRDTTAEGIDIKEGTTGGVIRGNVFAHSGFSGANFADSWVDVKGNGYAITANVGSGTLLDAFQVHTAMAGWGNKNSFAGNTVTSGVPGYEVSVQSGASGTVVECGSTGAAKGMTNITCAAPVAAAPVPTAPAAAAPAAVTLATSTSGSVTASVTAPTGVTVKFKVDGVYLGQDSSAPYSFTFTPTAGTHKLNVRWDVAGTTTSIDTEFTSR